jgi:hypothetical protein
MNNKDKEFIKILRENYSKEDLVELCRRSLNKHTKQSIIIAHKIYKKT